MDAVIRRFLEILDREGLLGQIWYLKQARRAGVVIFVDSKKFKDTSSGIKWDPEVFIRQPSYDKHNLNPKAWRREFVEKVVALDCVPDLESYPPVNESL